MKTKLLELWNKIKKGVIITGLILGCLIIAFIAGKCSTREERKQAINNISALNSEIKQTEVIIEGLKNTVYEKDAVILSQKDAIATGTLERERLKKLHLSELITNTELSGIIKKQDSLLNLPPNTVFITIKDTSGVTRDYVRIPFQLLKTADKYITLNAGMDKNKKAWFDLSIPFSGTVTIGNKRTGLFKTTPVGIFTTEIPYLKVNDMSVLIIQEPKGILSKWYVHAGAGALFIELLRIAFIK
jgi:hypothetical protein